MGMKNQFNGIMTNENECDFKGSFSTPIGAINYNAKCSVNGNVLHLITNSNKGNFTIQGKRI